MDKVLSHLKNWGIGVNYCWNYGSSKLLLHFIQYRLDHFNNRHTKIAVNSTIQFFKSHYQKKCLLKVFRCIHHKMTALQYFLEIETKLSFNTFKLHKYQIFPLMKIHNMNKIWFGDNKFSLWKSLVYDWQAVENTIF